MTVSGDEIAFHSATGLAALVAAREISPVELVDAVLTRIEERNPGLNALVHIDVDHARRAAVAAERAVASGEALGRLHGVPTALKDLFSSKPGWVSTNGGIPALEDNRVDRSCVYADRMEAAGAIVVGSTNSPSFGFRAVCDNELFGPTCNPFDLERNSGGSSGGSAAAVADGILHLAEGTDAGGSIRIPAAWNNLVGHTPSAGRVPLVMRPDGFAATSPFIHDGVLTRTVEDAVVGLEVLAGAHPADPFSVDERPRYGDVLDGDLTGVRVAYSPDLGVHEVDPAVAETVRGSLRGLEAAGARVEDIAMTIPYDQAELSALWCRCITRVSVPLLDGLRAGGVDLEALGQIPEPMRPWLDEVTSEDPRAWIRDSIMRTAIFDAFQGVLGEYDLLVAPTLGAMPVPNAGVNGATMGPAEINGVAVDPSIGWTLTYLVNFTGHPACSVPAGLSDGLPVGTQIIGRRFADGDVLRAAAALERERPWWALYPALRHGGA